MLMCYIEDSESFGIFRQHEWVLKFWCNCSIKVLTEAAAPAGGTEFNCIRWFAAGKQWIVPCGFGVSALRFVFTVKVKWVERLTGVTWADEKGAETESDLCSNHRMWSWPKAQDDSCKQPKWVHSAGARWSSGVWWGRKHVQLRTGCRDFIYHQASGLPGGAGTVKGTMRFSLIHLRPLWPKSGETAENRSIQTHSYMTTRLY